MPAMLEIITVNILRFILLVCVAIFLSLCIYKTHAPIDMTPGIMFVLILVLIPVLISLSQG